MADKRIQVDKEVNRITHQLISFMEWGLSKRNFNIIQDTELKKKRQPMRLAAVLIDRLKIKGFFFSPRRLITSKPINLKL